MTIEQRIEHMKKRNEFFYDEDIALCIRSLEAWQKVNEEFDKDKYNFDSEDDYARARLIIDNALEKVGEQDGNRV